MASAMSLLSHKRVRGWLKCFSFNTLLFMAVLCHRRICELAVCVSVRLDPVCLSSCEVEVSSESGAGGPSGMVGHRDACGFLAT